MDSVGSVVSTGIPDENVLRFLNEWARAMVKTDLWQPWKATVANMGKEEHRGKGKGNNGNGNGYFGGKGYNGYRSPGKAIGKGFNHWGEGGYTAAWGGEMDYYNYDHDDWE